jgi:hypothetical protein
VAVYAAASEVPAGGFAMPDLLWLLAVGLFVLVVVLTAVYSGN